MTIRWRLKQKAVCTHICFFYQRLATFLFPTTFIMNHQTDTTFAAHDSVGTNTFGRTSTFKRKRSSSSSRKGSNDGDSSSCYAEQNPQETLISILQEHDHIFKTVSSESLKDFFEEVTEDEIQAYDADALRAIRESDMETLRRYLKENRPLKCSNRFGESLLHLACRRNLIPVVQFLVHEAGVPLNVRDDMGRSPLHDAFWCAEVNFELVDLILDQCPDLLLISDKRGHPPLSYARQHHWKSWNAYLHSRSQVVQTISLGSTTDSSSATRITKDY